MLILQLKCLNWVGASWDWLVFIKLINIKDSCTCGSFRIFPLYITKPLSNNLILSHSFNHAIIWEVNFGQGCTSRQVCQHLVDFVNLCSNNNYSNDKCRQAPCQPNKRKVQRNHHSYDWPTLHLGQVLKFAWYLLTKHVQPSCFEGSKFVKTDQTFKGAVVLPRGFTTYILTHPIIPGILCIWLTTAFFSENNKFPFCITGSQIFQFIFIMTTGLMVLVIKASPKFPSYSCSCPMYRQVWCWEGSWHCSAILTYIASYWPVDLF